MKNKEKLEAVLSVVSAGAGLGAGLYLSRGISNEVPDVLGKLAIISFSITGTSAIAKFIDDAFIVPYYQAKAFYEKYGMRRYRIPAPME